MKKNIFSNFNSSLSALRRPQRIAFWLTVGLLLVFAFTPRGYAAGHENGTAAGESSPVHVEVQAELVAEPGVAAEAAATLTPESSPQTFPYKKTFVISGYYSPLPDQSRYYRGSYEAELILEGNGTNGADGTPVYPGMIAAPSNFPFGTKIEIPGLGMGTVHDRGGAIKGNRLDIWFGRGEEGLRRAFGWGMRTVEVTVYGVNDALGESVNFDSVPLMTLEWIGSPARAQYFTQNLATGDSGENVSLLQTFLKKSGFYSGEVSGKYDEQTALAVRAFQLQEKVISSADDSGSGVFGPRTRVKFEAFLMRTKQEKSALLPHASLQMGDSGDSVRAIQNFLKENGYAIEITGNFDEKTRAAVIQFQAANGVISSVADSGTGYVGPRTLIAMRSIIAKTYTPAANANIVLAASTTASMAASAATSVLTAAPTTTDHSNVTASVTVAHTLIASASATATLPVVHANEVASQPVFKRQLALGSSGDDVKLLQEELVNLHFLGVAPTGYYGEITQHAVFKFQQAFGLVANESDQGAGLLGPLTAERLNEIIYAREKQKSDKAFAADQKTLIASRINDEKELFGNLDSSLDLASDLAYGSRGPGVERLQRLLKKLGFFPGQITTEYFGDSTKKAIMAFQNSHGLPLSGAADPLTRRIINQILGPAALPS